jgi:hypothetical protein
VFTSFFIRGEIIMSVHRSTAEMLGINTPSESTLRLVRAALARVWDWWMTVTLEDDVISEYENVFSEDEYSQSKLMGVSPARLRRMKEEQAFYERLERRLSMIEAERASVHVTHIWRM